LLVLYKGQHELVTGSVPIQYGIGSVLQAIGMVLDRYEIGM